MQRRSSFGRCLSGALITCGIGLTDLFTKRMVANSFSLGERLEVIPGFFAITYILNPGVAFGLLSGWDSWLRLPFLLGGTVVALAFILYLYFGPLAHGKLAGLALPLIAGGALANFYERVTIGAVVDYLDFYVSSYHWPAFNLADASITLGVALLLVDSLWDHSGATQPA
jgi:signal peptidase II